MKYHRRGLMPHHPQEPSEVNGHLADLADTTGRDLKRAGIPRASARAARIVDRLGLVNVVFARIGGESPTLTKPMLRKALAVTLDVDRQASGVMRRASRGDHDAIVQLLADTVLNNLRFERDWSEPLAERVTWTPDAYRLCAGRRSARVRPRARGRAHRTRRASTRSCARSGDSGSDGGDADPAGEPPAPGPRRAFTGGAR